MKIICENEEFGLTNGKEYEIIDIINDDEDYFYTLENDNGEIVNMYQSRFYVSEK